MGCVPKLNRTDHCQPYSSLLPQSGFRIRIQNLDLESKSESESGFRIRIQILDSESGVRIRIQNPSQILILNPDWDSKSGF
uniref:Uncharacterized protein n=1 Tax=Acrobeloides nanus TaxID=290746 RepID=A0A914CC71_9BILA